MVPHIAPEDISRTNIGKHSFCLWMLDDGLPRRGVKAVDSDDRPVLCFGVKSRAPLVMLRTLSTHLVVRGNPNPDANPFTFLTLRPFHRLSRGILTRASHATVDTAIRRPQTCSILLHFAHQEAAFVAVSFKHLAGVLGHCGGREVFLGFAPASFLKSVSFADVLDEESGKGYQRRFSEEHSLEFRKYIQRHGATTIPLTFNLRPVKAKHWRLKREKDGRATLSIDERGGPILAQVDCQHRLGYLDEVSVSLAFMTFIGLSVREETEIFNIINSKAKGLSSSLLDFHASQLVADLGTVKPEIYIALKMNDAPESPWHGRLDLGGKRTVGTRRYASLRTMQKAVRRFLRESRILGTHSADEAFRVIQDFWTAVTKVLSKEWNDPRRHFLTKGIGVYSLMSVAGDLYVEGVKRGAKIGADYFTRVLSDFISDIDWSSRGDLQGFGGAGGADQALSLIRERRKRHRLKAVGNGR